MYQYVCQLRPILFLIVVIIIQYESNWFHPTKIHSFKVYAYHSLLIINYLYCTTEHNRSNALLGSLEFILNVVLKSLGFALDYKLFMLSWLLTTLNARPAFEKWKYYLKSWFLMAISQITFLWLNNIQNP